MKIKFSIVTPSFNQAGFIEETILSVLSQKVELEYWVIDGGSTDGTINILKRFAKKDPRFHFISAPDKGQSDAINKGIRKMKGNVFAYLNSDDLYQKNALKNIEQAILYDSKYPTKKNQLPLGWYYGRATIVDDTGKVIAPIFTRLKHALGKYYSYFKLLCLNPISQPAVFIKKEALDATGFFNIQEFGSMDYEYWLRLGKAFHAKSLPIDIAKFRLHKTSKTSLNTLKLYKNELFFAWKYCPKRFPFLFSQPIHLLHFFAIVIWMRCMHFSSFNKKKI